jgi:hydroxymethylpyrimidine/phosphomethylpyrimidine kinase
MALLCAKSSAWHDMSMKRILTIAASDSGGGAGIQADIKTISMLNGFALSAVTALTAQNTCEVVEAYPAPADFVVRQLDVVCRDIGVDAAKTGMLLNCEVIEAVAGAVQRLGIGCLVVDPVMRASSGAELLEVKAVDALRHRLLPLAAVVTPNLAEASVLAGMPVDSIAAMHQAVHAIHAAGPRAVLITGGHLDGDCVDVLYDGSRISEFASPRIPTRHTHGTGCVLSAALATLLAAGIDLHAAVAGAKAFTEAAIHAGLPLGKGDGPVSPCAATLREAALYRCAEALRQAFCKLQSAAIGHLIPEIQSNLGYALPDAQEIGDVLAFPGRIIRLGGTIARVADPAPGASRHIAKILLTCAQYAPAWRAAMNIIWTPELIRCCERLGMTVCEFDRREEPADVKEREGSTLEWGTRQVLSAGGPAPDIIFDRGDIGKEPVSRVLGADPCDVADKIIRIAAAVAPC